MGKSYKALEAEYAFLQGFSDFIPMAGDYGVSDSRTSEIVGMLLEGEEGVEAA